jgi:hypothetical protein
MNLTNILPSVITNLVLDYYDPVREAQQRNQKKINRAFGQIMKMNSYNYLLIQDKKNLYGCEIDDTQVMYPSVITMNSHISEYKKSKKTVMEYFRSY